VTKLEAYIGEVLKRGLDDWIQAAEVVAVVQSIDSEASVAEVQRVALEVIDELVCGDFMRAGDVTAEGFTEWPMTPSSACRRIRTSWNALGRLPELGEICWLANTPRGDRRV